MGEALLTGTRVVELAGEPAQLGGRILADLGAEVVKVELPEGDPLRGVGPFAGDRRDSDASLRFAAWNAGKTGLVSRPDAPELGRLLATADVVIDTPGWPGTVPVDPALAPQAVWVRVTPFGLTGPRAGWRASDLGVLAASGNMSATGYPDRPPLRCTEPTAYAHAGPEIAVAALTGLASGRPQVIDLSLQETYLVANMGNVGAQCLRRTRLRRAGATIMGMREIWRCKDGWVSFGIRGGPPRVATNRLMTRILEDEGLATQAWSERDWAQFNVNELSDAERRAVEEPLASYFGRHTLAELYELATANNLLLATCNTPRELYGSAQLASRGMFAKLGDLDGFPTRFALVRSPDDRVDPPEAQRPAPRLAAGPAPDWAPRPSVPATPGGGKAWEGVGILEFGSGAAGPIGSRYFAEHGATVVRIESKSRPEFLRTMAMAAKSPHGVEGNQVFNSMNVGKRSVTLNLKTPSGLEVAKRLVSWADLVLENFAPKAMRGFGLHYDALVQEKPDLLMISACANGQTGPYRDYPGFGSQLSALAGYTHLTGFPDRAPVGPFGTITDAVAPRFVATAIGAALLYKRRTGRGLYLDLSQVESAVYTLAPWLLDFAVNGRIGDGMGNRSPRTAPHGAFPCRGEDAWVAIAVWSDAEWRRLAKRAGIERPEFETLSGRFAGQDELERCLAEWTSGHTSLEVAEQLQAEGIEAVPVLTTEELYDDPQLAEREHLDPHEHPAWGEFTYERNGFRLSDAPSGYPGPAPTLGQHTREVLRELLGYDAAEIDRLQAAGGVE